MLLVCMITNCLISLKIGYLMVGVDEEISPDNVERFECFEKHYINIMNYYHHHHLNSNHIMIVTC